MLHYTEINKKKRKPQNLYFPQRQRAWQNLKFYFHGNKIHLLFLSFYRIIMSYKNNNCIQNSPEFFIFCFSLFVADVRRLYLQKNGRAN